MYRHSKCPNPRARQCEVVSPALVACHESSPAPQCSPHPLPVWFTTPYIVGASYPTGGGSHWPFSAFTQKNTEPPGSRRPVPKPRHRRRAPALSSVLSQTRTAPIPGAGSVDHPPDPTRKGKQALAAYPSVPAQPSCNANHRPHDRIELTNLHVLVRSSRAAQRQ